jgi:hypothetical protein
MKEAVRHVRRSCDFSSLTGSAAHSRASGIFLASRKARAFARAWLRADRSAGDSFPGRALRSAADVLRIATGPSATRFRRATNLNRQRSRPRRLSVPATAVPLSRMLAETAAELATARSVEEAAPPTANRVAAQPTRAEPTRLCLDRAAYLIQVGVPVPAPRSSPRAASARFGRGASAGPASRFRQPAPRRAHGAIPPCGHGSRRQREVGSSFLPSAWSSFDGRSIACRAGSEAEPSRVNFSRQVSAHLGDRSPPRHRSPPSP